MFTTDLAPVPAHPVSSGQFPFGAIVYLRPMKALGIYA